MDRYLKLKLPGGKFLNVSVSRSRTMSAIRGKHTRSTEQTLRMALTRAGIKGWRTQAVNLPGKPDLYFPAQKLAVFVDGCFWHFCPRCGHIPATRRPFWRAKIERNRTRDKQVKASLGKLGIRTLRIWEHELRHKCKVGRAIQKITRKLNSGLVTRTKG